MIIQWQVLLAIWSLILIKVSLAEYALRDSRALWEPNHSSSYIEADADSNSISPSEEKRRFQRSFLKKFWKNSGLQDLFGDEGCVSCCKNEDYQAGEGDTYQTPPAAANYLPLTPPLAPLPRFDPLRLFQPFFRPVNGNEQNNNGYSNNYDSSGTNSNVNDGVNPNCYESGNSNNEANPNKNLNDGKTDVTYEKPNVDYSEDGYVKPELGPKSHLATVVYQPIIYVSPQYTPAPTNNGRGDASTYPGESPYNSQPSPSAAITTQPCRCYGESDINPTNGVHPPKMPNPIILTAADQPYRNCPELFTEYCNKINYLY
ncbi:unnamed protein product [Ceratitis capitata]|uniref:(Mediterranean fruit fly) hypothetical protein n=1 Tax=Ceratitis capitata TaxID=7213 RepID=A0A811UG06_CERCA|nr:unnamed protein product [Ceratitis capitata]